MRMIPELGEPPQDLEAERSLLGAIISYPESLEKIAHTLRPQHFYLDIHGAIYSACLELFLHQNPIDGITVGAFLEKNGQLDRIGGRAGLWRLTSEGYVRQNVTYYADIITGLHQKRQIINIARETIATGLSNGISAQDFLDITIQKLFQLTKSTGHVAERLGDNAVPNYLESLSKAEPPPRLAWPWANLDNILHGLRPGEMTVIGGRPGSGKTALAMNLALDLGMEKKKTVGIYSLEMSKTQLVNRMLAQLATVDSAHLQDAKVSPEEWERILRVSVPLSEAAIHVNDNSSLTEIDFITESRKLKFQYDVNCIILDYLQLLKGTGKAGSREQEVSSFAQTAKRIARELDIAVVVLSSLNRDPERREDHRPMISDFRESGGIENEADVIIGLYRDYYYHPQADPLDAEAIVLKHRNGPTGVAHLKFEKKYTMFWSED